MVHPGPSPPTNAIENWHCQDCRSSYYLAVEYWRFQVLFPHESSVYRKFVILDSTLPRNINDNMSNIPLIPWNCVLIDDVCKRIRCHVLWRHVQGAWSIFISAQISPKPSPNLSQVHTWANLGAQLGPKIIPIFAQLGLIWDWCGSPNYSQLGPNWGPNGRVSWAEGPF